MACAVCSIRCASKVLSSLLSRGISITMFPSIDGIELLHVTPSYASHLNSFEKIKEPACRGSSFLAGREFGIPSTVTK